MAILGKETFVHSVLKSLDNINALEALLNNPGTPTEFHLLSSTFSDGSSFVRFCLDDDDVNHSVLTGFLCKKGTLCGFFGYAEDMENMFEIKIDTTNRIVKFIDEGLDVEEFRREIADIVIAGGDVHFDAHDLIKLMEGDIGVSVDLNEAQTKVVASLDMTGAVVNSLLVSGSGGESATWKTLETALKAVPGEDEGKFMTLESTGIGWTEIPTPDTIDLTSLTLTASSGVYTSSETFTKDVHVVVECEMSGTHACFGIDLHRYDGSISYGVARVNWGGTILDVNCHLDSSGHVVLDLASLTGLTTVYASYYKYK